MKTILVIAVVLLLLIRCDWIPIIPGPCDASGPVIVYKTKQDYSNNLTVQLSKDGKSVTAYPGKQDAIRQRPVALANGYLLKRMAGDVVLSLTIDEYSNSSKDYSSAEFMGLIIDRDPYLEKYECCECTQGDITLINDLIRKNQLDKCKDLK